MGNSITQAGGYVNFLSDKLGDDYDVRNYGLSGRTLLKVSNNTYWDEAKFREIFTWKPNIITIMLGTNDSKTGNWGTGVDHFEDDLQAMVDTFHTITPKPQIILVHPPHAGEERFTIRGSIIRGEIMPLIKKVADRNNLNIIDVNTPTLDKMHLMPDEVHPNAEGHLVMGDIFLEGILNFAADRSPPRKLLYYGDAPEANGTEASDKPDLQIYLAEEGKNTGAAVIICPGGGYGNLAMDHEGTQVAEWYNELGINAFILKYRYSPYRHPVPLGDASRAMRIVRYYAEEWGIDTSKIGIMGFSAGGHLASTLSTHFDGGNSSHDDPIERMKSRPDFSILIYPVITLEGPYAHNGSRNNLLGQNPENELVQNLSNHLQVSENTPPAFMGHGDKDDPVPLENSQMYDSALSANNVDSRLIVDPGKAHGYGLNGIWPDSLAVWLDEMGIADIPTTVPNFKSNHASNSPSIIVNISGRESSPDFPRGLFIQKKHGTLGEYFLYNLKGKKIGRKPSLENF